jgi:hypothetical protein
VSNLRVEVTLSDFWSELHFFRRDLDGLLSRFLQTLGFLVSEFAVVHDSTHRRIGLGRNFDKVEFCGTRSGECVFGGHDSYLRTIGVNEANFGNSNALVVPRLIARRCYDWSLLFKRLCLL